MTTNAIHYDVATLLNDNALGTLGTDLFGGEWGTPDAQTLVLDGAGTPSDLKELYEQPSVQILVRGERQEAAHMVYTKAKVISDFLLSQSECVTINATDYKGFEQGSNIAALGKDENERHIYSMNFYTWRNAF
jgi:hypothetical protein